MEPTPKIQRLDAGWPQSDTASRWPFSLRIECSQKIWTVFCPNKMFGLGWSNQPTPSGTVYPFADRSEKKKIKY